jgi:hypothetical protein
MRFFVFLLYWCNHIVALFSPSFIRRIWNGFFLKLFASTKSIFVYFHLEFFDQFLGTFF